jgi:putative endonuclease
MIQRFITKWQKRGISKRKNLAQHRPKSRKRVLAEAGESFTSHYLRSLGWQIKEQNWRMGRQSEIDIIAVDPKGTLVFVEVKARRMPVQVSGFIDAGFDSINARKQNKIKAGASHYLAKHPLLDLPCRFDAAVLYYPEHEEGLPDGELPTPQINYVENIF